MSEIIKIISLKPFNEVMQVYSGHPGCACGCQGKYYPNSESDNPTLKDKRMMMRVYKLFKNNMSNVYSYKDREDQFIVLNKGANRTYTIYWRK